MGEKILRPWETLKSQEVFGESQAVEKIRSPLEMRTTLIITMLNEIEGMRTILPRIKKEWVDEMIVIDGGSTDGSFEYAQSLGLATFRQKFKGLIDAYREGLEVATGEVIIPFSPDGNSIPERIPDLVQKMREGFDMVIVSRYLDGAKSEDDDWVSAFGNWLFTKLINLLFGGHYTDTLVMFRAWKREIVEAFEIDPSLAGFEPQLSIECLRRGLKVAEIPGDEPKRIGGRTKKRTIAAGWAILLLIVRELFLPVHPRTAGKESSSPLLGETIRK